MRQTLALMIGAALPLLAGAQVPPTPPSPASAPAPAARPAPAPRPARPLPPIEPRWDFDFRFDSELFKVDADMFRIDAERVRHEAMEAARHAQEEMRLQRPQIDRAMELARADIERVKFEALEHSRVNVEHIRSQALEASRTAMMDMPLIRPEIGFGPGRTDKFLEAKPRQGWKSEDPADSLYRVAREALNRGEWRRAAQLFNDVVKKHPRSTYAVNSAYWEAFSRYRSGGTDDLRAARKILEDGRAQFAQLRENGDSGMDVPGLLARIQSALAARGDEAAAEAIRRESREAGQTPSCDREEMSVRAEALSALGQMDAATALPVVRKVLARRDDCSVELRRRALYVVGRQTTSPDVSGIILEVAKNDPDNSIRGEAMRLLPRVAGDNAVPQLEEILRTSTDESQQRMAVNALNAIDSDRARRAVRTIIERNDATERVRYEAISGFLRERDGRAASPEDQNYIRGQYAKLEPVRLREAVLSALSRVETPENLQFMLAIVKNQNETPALRSSAVQRVGRMNGITAAEIAKLYDVADTRSLREHILSALSQRKEDEAVDKMIEIGKKDTDPQIRRYAITLLGRSNNPRAQQFLKDMWNQP